MKNNSIDKISLGSGRHKKARFNLSHDVNSTYQFGEIQPVLFRDMIANEKDVVQIESMVRLSPMVAPTFGRIKHKEFHHFIPTTDLFPHYGNFLSQTSYRGQTPTQLPSMTLGLLSHFCLAGSKMSIYWAPQSDGIVDADERSFRMYIQPDVSTTTNDVTNVLAWIAGSQGVSQPTLPFDFKINNGSNAWSIYNANTVDLKYILNKDILGGNPGLRSMVMPVANFDTNSWFDFADKSVDGTSLSYVTDLDVVSLDTADAVIPKQYADSSSNVHDCLLAFRFSNFGKRLYKILVGLGYQLDFTSTQRVSLLPLFAFFKAWFDSFGLTRYNAWQDTQAYKLLSMYDWSPSNYNFDQIADANIGSYFVYNDWIPFIVELGNCWFTEDSDFVNSHVADNFISPSADAIGSQAFSSDGTRFNISVYSPSSTISPVSGGTQRIPSVQIATNSTAARFSALSIKQLMDMYRWTNRNTIAGRAVEDLLRAQGYGYFLYSCKSNFIGYTEQDVPIYDVVSSSDTFNSSSNDGALLGQYAGRGLGYEKSKSMSFEATEDGFWIGLCCIVPQSGYSQSLNPSLVALDKFSRYNPDLDGKYMVLSPKSFVQGSMPFASLKVNEFNGLSAAFGFIPIYSGFKVANNVSNGGFSLRSQRDIFRPYMLDKVIDFGERRVILDSESSTSRDYTVQKSFKLMPVAGEYWKYIGRYPWMGNFDRIFAHAEHNTDLLNQLTTLGMINDMSYEYSVVSDDNFLIHHVVNQQAYAPMLPIEQSFDTQDEDGNFDTSLEHA